jgi:GNAT superfamily N-acetyltransferase
MSDKYSITLEESPAPEDTRFVFDSLQKFNFGIVGDDNHHSLAIFLRDNEGHIVGGLLGDTYWGWLYVSILWIEESLRGQGYGDKLLGLAEQEAIARGCKHAHLDTFDFQALPFYEKRGYTVYGVLDDLPEGHKRLFLQKKLVSE